MIKFEEALEIVLNTNISLGKEEIKLKKSLGRILAQDIFSDIDMPPFNKSAMDGYACRSQDINNELEVIEIIPAGKTPKMKIGKNQCAKIMTGAPLPEGADTVFIVEKSMNTSENKVKYTGASQNIDSCNAESGKTAKQNICFIGEDIKKGQKVLDKGTLIKPQHIAVMASAGCVNPTVSKKPRVAVIATGSELVEPHIKPSKSQIRNSNGAQMMAQLKQNKICAKYYGIAHDNQQTTEDIFNKAMTENDIIMLSGGVSEGDFDFVPHILKKAGFEIKFDRVAVQPGKPTTFALAGNKICFAMPGNPVSSFVQFEILLKPLLYKLMGHNLNYPQLILPMGTDFFRKKTNRLSWIPVNINEQGLVIPVEYHGSAHINGLSSAHGLIAVPIDVNTIKKGELVYVRQI